MKTNTCMNQFLQYCHESIQINGAHNNSSFIVYRVTESSMDKDRSWIHLLWSYISNSVETSMFRALCEIWSCFGVLSSLFFHSSPKSGSLGSAAISPARHGTEPQPKSNFVHYRPSSKIWHLMWQQFYDSQSEVIDEIYCRWKWKRALTKNSGGYNRLL